RHYSLLMTLRIGSARPTRQVPLSRLIDAPTLIVSVVHERAGMVTLLLLGRSTVIGFVVSFWITTSARSFVGADSWQADGLTSSIALGPKSGPARFENPGHTFSRRALISSGSSCLAGVEKALWRLSMTPENERPFDSVSITASICRKNQKTLGAVSEGV